MPVPSNVFVDRISGSLEEVLGRSMLMEVMASDPIYESMVLGSAGLVPVGEMGRDYRFRKRYHQDAGGVIRGGNLNNYGMSLYGEAATPQGVSSWSSANVSQKMMLQTVTQTWPDPLGGLAPDQFGCAFDLYSFETNLALTLSEMTAENVPAAVRDFIAPKLRGMGKRLAIFFATSYYMAGSNQLGTFPATVAAGDIGAGTAGLTYIILRPQEQSLHRFMVGQEIDIWPSTFPTSGNRLNQQTSGTPSDTNETHRVRCWVADVRDTDGYVLLFLESGTASIGGGTYTWGTNFTTTTLASAYVTPANTYGGTSPVFAKLFGWRDFAKWGATTAAADNRILGANALTGAKYDFIDIRSHSEFASWHKGSVGSLTNELLAQILDAAEVAFRRNGDTIDTLIGCRGLWRNQVETEQLKERTDVTGSPSSMQGRGSNVGATFVVDGRVYTKKTSDYLEDGKMLGLRGGNNYQLAVPPDPDMVKKGGLPELPDKIPFRFIMPALTGGAMTRFPLLRTGSSGGAALPTEATMMPGMVRAQMFPGKQMRMLVLEGCTTSRLFSTA